jgi:hypothetical protein
MDATDSTLRQTRPEPRLSRSPIAAFSGAPLGPAVQGLIALAIYIGVCFVGLGMALVGHLDVPSVGQNKVDPQLFIWSWQWWPYAVTHWINPLYTTQIGAPTGYNLAAWTTTSPAIALFMWPVTALWGPVVSFNLTLLLAPPTAAWAAFVAARRLTKRFWASLIGGALYGFSLYELTLNLGGDANVSVTLLFPLMVYLVLLWWDGTLGRTGFMIWMAIALALEFYTFSEVYFDVTMVIAAALVVGFAVAGRELRPKVARLAGLTAIAYVGSLVLASPYLIYELRNMPSGLTRNAPQYELHWAGLIVPRAARLWGMPSALVSFSRDNPDNIAYVGIPLLVLLILFTAFRWSSRVTRLLVITFVAVLALGSGSTFVVKKQPVFSLPWGALWNLPILRGAETNRFMLFGYLVLALVLALWLAAPAPNRLLRAARWGLAVLSIAAIFANLPTFADVMTIPPPSKSAVTSVPRVDTLPAFITDGLYKRYLRPGEIVVVVSVRGNAGMLFQAEADFYFRIAGGFINASLMSTDAIPQPIAVLSHVTPARKAEFKAFLKASGVGAIIVEQGWSEHWMYVFGQLGMRATSVGGVTIFRTKPA